jgi:hypothetical protein
MRLLTRADFLSVAIAISTVLVAGIALNLVGAARHAMGAG